MCPAPGRGLLGIPIKAKSPGNCFPPQAPVITRSQPHSSPTGMQRAQVSPGGLEFPLPHREGELPTGRGRGSYPCIRLQIPPEIAPASPAKVPGSAPGWLSRCWDPNTSNWASVWFPLHLGTAGGGGGIHLWQGDGTRPPHGAAQRTPRGTQEGHGPDRADAQRKWGLTGKEGPGALGLQESREMRPSRAQDSQAMVCGGDSWGGGPARPARPVCLCCMHHAQ
ncbi:trafficking protein particle complex subunit 10 [Platysternon megacephalum]|uniref:Trafficking protein particle complex subunit 10 n=1 Tax=Platysternon megacephalum TaxID=55544 RepID=A0A4D9E6C7_9SAUR|nr:trafficking protein particle complex subunit 10 [Platysternon megacephalum]